MPSEHVLTEKCCAVFTGSAAAGSPAAIGAVGKAGQCAAGGGAAARPLGDVLQSGPETNSCKQHNRHAIAAAAWLVEL